MARGSGATVRDNPYSGPSKLAVPFPGSEPAKTTQPIPVAAEPAKTTTAAPAEPIAPEPAKAAEPTDSGSQDDDEASTPRRRRVFDRGERSLAGTLSPPRAGDLSGALFAVIAWSWIVLPLVQGGPSRVRDVWRAKWLNKGPDGKRLA